MRFAYVCNTGVMKRVVGGNLRKFIVQPRPTLAYRAQTHSAPTSVGTLIQKNNDPTKSLFSGKSSTADPTQTNNAALSHANTPTVRYTAYIEDGAERYNRIDVDDFWYMEKLGEGAFGKVVCMWMMPIIKADC